MRRSWNLLVNIAALTVNVSLHDVFLPLATAVYDKNFIIKLICRFQHATDNRPDTLLRFSRNFRSNLTVQSEN